MQQYDFYGRHLLLNFSGCEADLNDLEMIKRDMTDAINVIGATILSHLEHKFTPEGLSIIFLLSESHASIHTYPEYNACFLDVFTCGETIFVEPFGDILEERWRPRWVSRQMQERFDPARFDPTKLDAEKLNPVQLDPSQLKLPVLSGAVR
ncbi:MAG: adenosylmethionine decarboxylase [Alkalinema sp. CACIAM 70d]|nr:MAG: adenosylmethionine decarboxylase [Alkalinema sp. CACIAM 70d]